MADDPYASIAQPATADPYAAIAKPTSVMKAAPATGSLPWIKEKLYNAADAATNALPGVGGATGAMIGAGALGTAGVTTGPGALEAASAGEVGGAGIGGMGGEAARQLLRRLIFPEEHAPQTSNEAAGQITKEGAIQGAIQGVTEGAAAAAPALGRAAVGQYSRALAPTTKVNKAIVQDIAPEMVNRGIRGNLESIENQASAAATDLRPKLDAVIDAIPDDALEIVLQKLNSPAVPKSSPAEITAGIAGQNARRDLGSTAATVPQRILGEPNPVIEQIGSQAATVPQSVYGPKQGSALVAETVPSPVHGAISKVMDSLDSLRGKYIVDGKVANPKAVSAIDGVKELVGQFGSDVSPQSLRKLRQIFDDPVAKAGGFAGADLSSKYELRAQEEAANSIRDIMAQASPDLAKLNAETHFWLQVQQVARDSGLRQTGQQGGLLKTLGPLGVAGAAAMGATHLGGSAALSVEAAAISSMVTAVGVAARTPAWRTTSAVIKNGLADALATGNVSRAASILTRFGVALQANSQTSGTSGQTAAQ